MKLMIKINIIIWILIFSIGSHAQNDSIQCPTLSELGITQFNEDNFNLPLPKSSDQTLCGLRPDGFSCYSAWNVTKEPYAQGWLILITFLSKDGEDALLNLNQSEIFYTSSFYDPILGCQGVLGTIEWNLYSPDSLSAIRYRNEV
ncbi:hypothetical protein [Legionella quateirensis]|uniref:Uncharacterized protein n=1 Tax=Legionella quateirensis TaxID=45072 RepID=A0A378KQK1_9GAMM|nr:hypothetical protein [Legionella quateirensis]KTD44650.1 hypothetical protein Lqua_2817 [Legionella quateirensis]STY16832.1 Uncharacterised protein [Legionella quateirensis]